MLLKIIKAVVSDFLAFFYWLYILALNRTLTFETVNESAWEKESRVIFALWHRDTFVPFYYYRYRRIVMIVMTSRRGQILGWCARRLGYDVIALSGKLEDMDNAKGLMRFVRQIKKGDDGMLAVDGPWGPAGEVKEGIFHLARKAKVPIVPCRVELFRYWQLSRRWDKYRIPYPFSKVRIIFTSAYFPRDDDDTEKKRLKAYLGS